MPFSLAGMLGGTRGATAAAAWKSASSYTRMGLAGAGLGAVYGGFSSDSSVLGGALKGGAMGLSAAFGVRAAKRWNYLRAGGIGSGQTAWNAIRRTGAEAGRLIGNTSHRAYNSFKSLG
jgi:hypothetical protein